MADILVAIKVLCTTEVPTSRAEGNVDMSSADYKIAVDTERCTGHGICESLAPDVFEVGDEGIVHVLTDDLSADLRPLLESAVAECPTQALSLTEPGPES